MKLLFYPIQLCAYSVKPPPARTCPRLFTVFPVILLILLYASPPASALSENGSGRKQVVGQSAEAKWNVTVNGCSSGCSISYDKNLSCWQGTLHYFEAVLVGTMRHYIVTQANRVVWRNRHEIPVDYTRMARESVRRITSRLRAASSAMPEIRSDANHLGTNLTVSRQIYKRIMPAMLDDARQLVSSLNAEETPHLPVLACPRGCERQWDPYMWLFIASSFVTFVLGAALILLTLMLEHREKRIGEAEKDEYGDEAKKVAMVVGSGTEKEEMAKVAPMSCEF